MMEALSAMASVMGDPYLLGLITGTTILGIIIAFVAGRSEAAPHCDTRGRACTGCVGR